MTFPGVNIGDLCADICCCGAFDLDNGSVVCWVCEQIVIPWVGSLTDRTWPA